MAVVTELEQSWHARLRADVPGQSDLVCTSIVQWLLGPEADQLNALDEDALTVARRAMAYRYRIFKERYWQMAPDLAYQRLIKRLSSLFLVRNKIRTWIALSRDRRRTVVDVVQEVVQEMVHSDRHMAQQITWIGQCTPQPRLRNLLMFASLEEYCLRPIRNQPLIAYRFVNYLRRSQKGGMTQVPAGELIRLVSDETSPDDSDDTLSLLDREAASSYADQQAQLAQQSLRNQVKTSFSAYLERTLGDTAVLWLQLHLQGHSQESIAQQLDLPIQQVYRLREKVAYHAVKVFALKEQPDIVLHWLQTSLKEHNLGLTPQQWDRFWKAQLPQQQLILTELKAGKSPDAIAQMLDLRPRQVRSQWMQLYLDAQTLRTSEA